MPFRKQRDGAHTTIVDLPHSFEVKKNTILRELGKGVEDYTDKSPKGSVDAEIVDLMDELNNIDGYVTTSSCAGRVAVFVEGRKEEVADAGIQQEANEEEDTTDTNSTGSTENAGRAAQLLKGKAAQAAAGPGGKGHGNKWLYVSHDPVPTEYLHSSSGKEFHDLLQLKPQKSPYAFPSTNQSPRLIKLTFSPLILHVLCATLCLAKPLLGAAINAGFRESGVQSLKALDGPDSGTMLAIRTAGLGFETVIGYVEETDGEEMYVSCVDEEYLKMCMRVVNERFVWNVARRERLRDALKTTKIQIKKQIAWEDDKSRSERKRAEGIREKLQKERQRCDETLSKVDHDVQDDDALDIGLLDPT